MWYKFSLEETRRKLRTNFEKGLTEEEVVLRRQKYGKNEIIKKRKNSIIIKFLNQFKDFMIAILIVAAIISAGLSYVEGTNEYIDSLIIITIVILNAVMGVIQENKAEKSLEALQKMSAPTCKVKRDEQIKQILTSELVPGDIVYLETGSYVPADIRLIESYDLKVEESALTGETMPVEKQKDKIIGTNVPIGDVVNMVFSSTIVVARTCKGCSSRNWNEY